MLPEGSERADNRLDKIYLELDCHVAGQLAWAAHRRSIIKSVLLNRIGHCQRPSYCYGPLFPWTWSREDNGHTCLCECSAHNGP